MSTEPVESPAADAPGVASAPRPAALRRSPRYGSFLATGALAGLVVAGSLPSLVGQAGYRWWDIAWRSGLLLAPLGALVGGIVVVLVERWTLRRAGVGLTDPAGVPAVTEASTAPMPRTPPSPRSATKG